MTRIHVVGVALCVALCLLSQAQAASGAKGADEKRFLVIAPERFHAALQGYLRYKQVQMPTDLVSLEKVLRTSPGVDDPERLKRYLYAGWKRRHVGYALLVGDADALPVRFMVLDRVTPAAFDYAFYPSDLYYSDLADANRQFDDWNAHKDGFHAGYFGEVRGEKNKQDSINYDRVDYRPDIAVGRWPVSTPEEVRTVADKTMRYEEGLRAGTKRGMRRAAFFAVGGWVDARGLMDSLAARLSPFWQVEKRYYADSGPKTASAPPDEANLRQILIEGVGLVFHAGHGADDCWEGCFYQAHLPQIKNADALPVMISAGCSTARFTTLPPYEAYVDVHGDEHAGTNAGEKFTAPPPPPAPYQKGRCNPTGLGEQLLRAGLDGAVAYIGCNTGSQPCALTLMEGFAQAVAASPHPRLGDCWAKAVAFYYDQEHLATLTPNDDWYPPSIFFQGMKFMLFGDPTLPLPAPATQSKRRTDAR
jgi:hypothetical protein